VELTFARYLCIITQYTQTEQEEEKEEITVQEYIGHNEAINALHIL